MKKTPRRNRSGFILPVVVACMLVVALIAGGVLRYVSYGARAGSMYTASSLCRLTAQTALERTEIDIRTTFKKYYKAYPSSLNALTWFDSSSSTSVGSTGYACALMQNEVIDGCTVSVTITDISKSTSSTLYQYAEVTLLATVSRTSAAGLTVSKQVEETVQFGMQRSSVFDHAYFVNNYGWFQGSGVTANGNIRSNGDMYLDRYSYINGNAYAAPNSELNATGYITVSGGGSTRHRSQSSYWALSGTWARPTNPTSSDTSLTWNMGYDGTSTLYSYQDTLDMPYLGDLSGYQEVAVNAGGTIKQNGSTLVDGYFNGTGPSGISGGADAGCIVLDGTSKPIIVDGPVVVSGDVIIKGTVTGQGAIYAGRNIHIVGNVTYKNPPSWAKPDSAPDETIKSNSSADMIGLVAKGNIVLGKYTDSTWLSDCRSYITTPFVTAYSCDSSDASIGYGSTFAGNYTANDSGYKVTYTYDSKKKTYRASGTTSRKYYESSVGDQIIKNYAQSASLSEIDAVLYNNHAVMGKVGTCLFNGAMVCRNEAIIYSSSVRFNWDSRLGSLSPDGLDFFIYLPMDVADPKVVGWREVL